MEHLPQQRTSRNPLPEALIVIAVVAGFFWSFSQGKLTIADYGAGIGFVVIITVFYFALLFCRMLFFWMTGGDTTPYNWMQWEHERNKKTK